MPKAKQPIKQAIHGAVTLAQTKQFLGNFNIEPGLDKPLLTYTQVKTIIKVARQWYGEVFGFIIEECFIPEGFILAPGHETVNSKFIFEPISWAEVHESLHIYQGLL